MIISTIGGLQLFTEPLLFSAGANSSPADLSASHRRSSMYMFESAFTNFNFGYGSATAWMLFLLIIIVALANTIVLRRIGDSNRQDR